MRRYAKAWAAILGVSALIALRYYDVNIPGIDQVVLDVIVGALTSFGVYRVRNRA